VSLAVVVVPIAVSVIVATVTAHLLPRPESFWWTLGWWALVLAVPMVVLVLADRLARKAMPLAVLLKMTMVFPDRAPKRLAVARKAGNTRDLARRVEEAKAHGVDDEPVIAAEKILALAAALNAHDHLTRGHSERVRAFTDLIANELELPQADRDRLRWSALLHDIGKLAVHSDILNKAGKLSDEEWVIVKNHPLEGAKLTASLADWLGPWANTIAEHHEKYDGTGYPYGLAGSQISYGGRIVAVADCYDTMTAVRSYKRAMTPQAARRELADCAGSHFDPKVVRAFLDVSIGRLRAVAGPLSWAGSLPLVSSVPRVGQAAAALGRAGAATMLITGSVAVGAAHGNTPTTSRSLPSPIASSGPEQPLAPGIGGPSTDSVAAPPGPKPTAARPGGALRATTPNGTPILPAATTTTGGSKTTASRLPATTVPGSSPTTVTPSPTSTITRSPTSTGPGKTTTVPSAPTGVSALAGDGQVALSWVAPNNGGSPITSYTVVAYVNGVIQTQWTFPSSATSEVVTGLTNGTTYVFTVIASNAVGPSTPSAPSAPVTPMAPSLSTVNGPGGQPGRPQQGDQIIIVFSPAPSPAAFCSGWNPTATGDLVGPNVLIQGAQPGTGDDTITVSDSTDCGGVFHFGTIDLGQRGYFSTTVTFGGPSGQCTISTLTGCSRIHWDGQNTLTITLGAASTGQPTQGAPSSAVYTPDPALGQQSSITSPKEVNF
jgi:putative nucleotidyltransferase with HDIG domain